MTRTLAIAAAAGWLLVGWQQYAIYQHKRAQREMLALAVQADKTIRSTDALLAFCDEQMKLGGKR